MAHDNPASSPERGEIETRVLPAYEEEALRAPPETRTQSTPIEAVRESAAGKESLTKEQILALLRNSKDSGDLKLKLALGPVTDEYLATYLISKGTTADDLVPQIYNSGPHDHYEGPSIGPLSEPSDRRRRTIVRLGADPTGVDPMVREKIDVWATPEEAEEMQTEEFRAFAARANVAALGGLAGISAARAANAAVPPAPPPARGVRPARPSAARTSQEARQAGLVDFEQGRLGLQSHSTAPTVRAAEGTTGVTHESMHIVPQAVYRQLDKSPGRALTLNMPKSVHREIDARWVPRWNAAVDRGQQITAADVYSWVGEAITRVQQSPNSNLPAATAGTLQWRLFVELYQELGLQSNSVIVPGKPVKP